MSTRSLTHVYENGITTPLLTFYRQSDGYPEGHGIELAEYLDGFKIVNGLSGNPDNKTANGMGCLAASLVANFKDGPGQIYIYTAGQEPWDCDAEYTYHIRQVNASVSLEIMEVSRIRESEKRIFFGTPADVIKRIKVQV
jgi:hypothetical protein